MELVIYIPGLGREESLKRQRNIIKGWQNDQRKTAFLDPRWREKSESFENKLKRLTDQVSSMEIDQYSKVIFFGTSAGGTLGLNIFNIFTDMDSSYFVAVSGKIVGPELIGKSYSRPNPALIPSVSHSVEIIRDQLKINREKRILSVIPIFDEVVNKKCMIIDGASHRKQLTIGHVPTIALSLTLFKNRYL